MNIQINRRLWFSAIQETQDLVNQVSHCLIFALLIQCKIALNRPLPKFKRNFVSLTQ